MEIVFSINSSRKREEELERSFYEEQKLHLKSEIDRISRRQEYQNLTAIDNAHRMVETRTGEAYAIVARYYDRMEGELPRDEIGASLTDILRSVSYRKGSSYYFILDSSGLVHLNREFPRFEGLSIESLQDREGKYFVREMIDLAMSAGEGHYSYLWFRNGEDSDQTQKKICHIRYLAPLDWIIGSSIFQENMVREIQNSLLANIDYVYSKNPEYIFIRKRDGSILNGPEKGRNVFADLGEAQCDVFRRMVETVDRGDGFLQFDCPQGGDLEYLAYVGEFPEWEWLIGARVTTEELQKKILAQKINLNETVKREFARISLLIVIFGLLSFLLLKRLSLYLTGDLSLFSDFFQDAASRNLLMDKSRLRFREFTELGTLANIMTRENIRAEGERQRNRNLESLGYLAGGIAHDFNNCLMGIYGNIELAQVSLDNPAEVQSYLENSLNSMERARKLTGRLLTFSHGGNLSPAVIPLLPLLKKTILPYQKREGIQIILTEPDEEYFLKGDEKQISLILEQIMANASEAITGKGGEIRVKAGRELLDDRFPGRLTGEFIRLDVEDNGRGIKEEDLPRIFDPYFTTKRMGRGLGLAVVFSIMHQHGGHVEADQAPGGGTVISLYFPIAADSADPV
ncbi:MAG: cache domain-containing protein [Spirochaetales bacterium]|nr:cache domain-containing protein [Spirochaetales bacterium]